MPSVEGAACRRLAGCFPWQCVDCVGHWGVPELYWGHGWQEQEQGSWGVLALGCDWLDVLLLCALLHCLHAPCAVTACKMAQAVREHAADACVWTVLG